MTQQRSGVDAATLRRLAEPTPRERIKSKPGRGSSGPISYVTARFPMDRLDDVVGPENWQDRYEDRPDGTVRAGLGILVDGEWVWKWDVGSESDIESEKGVHSDAFKRVAVKWGIARDLYPEHSYAAGNSSPAANGGAAGRPPRPAASTVPPEPAGEPAWLADEFAAIEAARSRPQPVQNGHSAATAGSDERMTMRELFSAAEAQGIAKSDLGAAAKKLYGGNGFIKDLDDEQRAVVWAEVAR